MTLLMKMSRQIYAVPDLCYESSMDAAVSRRDKELKLFNLKEWTHPN